MINMIIDKY